MGRRRPGLASTVRGIRPGRPWPPLPSSPWAPGRAGVPPPGWAWSRLIIVGQVPEHPGQVQLRVPGLESPVHRSLDAPLHLDLTHTLSEDIRVAAEICGRCERDGVDPVLDRDVAAAGEPRDASRECRDEAADLVGRQSAVDPPVALREVGV